MADIHSRKLLIAFAGIALLINGCGPSGPERFAVRGAVTLDGRPVENASVIFKPQGQGFVAAAVIEHGQYQFSAADGPSQGAYQIQINPNEIEIEEVEAAKLPRANDRPLIPLIFQQGKLTATVTGDPDQVLDFALTSDVKK